MLLKFNSVAFWQYLDTKHIRIALFNKMPLKEHQFLFLITGIDCRDTMNFLCLLLLFKYAKYASTPYSLPYMKFIQIEGVFSTFIYFSDVVDMHSNILSPTS